MPENQIMTPKCQATYGLVELSLQEKLAARGGQAFDDHASFSKDHANMPAQSSWSFALVIACGLLGCQYAYGFVWNRLLRNATLGQFHGLSVNETINIERWCKYLSIQTETHPNVKEEVKNPKNIIDAFVESNCELNCRYFFALRDGSLDNKRLQVLESMNLFRHAFYQKDFQIEANKPILHVFERPRRQLDVINYTMHQVDALKEASPKEIIASYNNNWLFKKDIIFQQENEKAGSNIMVKVNEVLAPASAHTQHEDVPVGEREKAYVPTEADAQFIKAHRADLALAEKDLRNIRQITYMVHGLAVFYGLSKLYLWLKDKYCSLS